MLDLTICQIMLLISARDAVLATTMSGFRKKREVKLSVGNRMVIINEKEILLYK